MIDECDLENSKLGGLGPEREGEGGDKVQKPSNNMFDLPLSKLFQVLYFLA